MFHKIVFARGDSSLECLNDRQNKKLEARLGALEECVTPYHEKKLSIMKFCC
jgi:hypothetical protein